MKISFVQLVSNFLRKFVIGTSSSLGRDWRKNLLIMSSQLWSHSGTAIFGDKVGGFCLFNWLVGFLFVCLIVVFYQKPSYTFGSGWKKWLQSLDGEGEFSLDRTCIYAWPVWGPFLKNPIRRLGFREICIPNPILLCVPCAL